MATQGPMSSKARGKRKAEPIQIPKHVIHPGPSEDGNGETSTSNNRLAALTKPRASEQGKRRVAEIPDTKGKSLKGRNVGKLANLMTMPMDIFFEITSKLHPVDILQLGRVSKHFRSIFMTRRAKHIWVAARSNVPALPDCPPDLDEPQYANLLFEHNCLACGKQRANLVDYMLRLRFCKPCLTENVSRGSTLLKRFGKKTDPVVYTLLPRSSVKLPTSQAPPESRLNDGNNAYYQPEFNKIVAQFLACEMNKDEREHFVSERQELSSQIMQSGVDLLRWHNDSRINKDEQQRQRAANRKASIEEKLEELGWDESSFPTWREWSHRYEWDKLLEQPRELTPRIWNAIQPKLEAIIRAVQEQRDRQNLATRKASRIEEFWRIYEAFLVNNYSTYLDRILMPRVFDASKLPSVITLIEEDEATIPVTQERLESILEDFSREAEEHKQAIKEDLLRVLGKSNFPTDGSLKESRDISPSADDADSLFLLPSSFFSCQNRLQHSTSCHHLRRYPEILDEVHVRERAWATSPVKYDHQTGKVAQYVLQALGLKADITQTELDALDGRFFCLCGKPGLRPMDFGDITNHLLTENQWFDSMQGGIQVENESFVINNDHDLKGSKPLITVLSQEEIAGVDVSSGVRLVIEPSCYCNLCYKARSRHHWLLSKSLAEHHMRAKHSKELEDGDTVSRSELHM
ncbi:hypothetical protein JAAARDRAFT_57740 [Jaapia argillacea MUCL 33604]|uniref:F-box domain-containing protein n=1 Tax=Jaapia argillacea MUCL 33604 TaxID=933084 RepID=A0A067PT92_9AGAM|nr:hypothetical protein JAAARDRAFT_57740 [Jaapia argillacea MUCL 33604]